MTAVSIEKLFKKYGKALYVISFFIIIFLNLQKVITSYNPFSLYYKQQTIKLIMNDAGNKTSVSFDTDLGLDAGLRFLLEKEGIKIADSENPPTHTIAIPLDRRSNVENEIIFGGVKVIQSQNTPRNY